MRKTKTALAVEFALYGDPYEREYKRLASEWNWLVIPMIQMGLSFE